MRANASPPPRRAPAAHRRRGLACLAAAWLCAAPASAASVEWFPHFAGRGWLALFANQGDALQDARFVTEGGLALDFAVVSRAETLSLRSRFEIVTTMGDSITQNLPFSPKEMFYEIAPYLEYRRGPLLWRAGWSHVCQHLIYKEYDDPWYVLADTNVAADVYFNRLFLAAGRAELRPEELRAAYFSGSPRADAPRWTWGVEAGGYLRSLPGVDDETLYSQNDWAWDLRADLRWILLSRPRWLLLAASRTQALLDVHDDAYWRQWIALEAHFASSAFGSMVYLGHHLVDEHPRDGREGLFELGASFYF
jgi:hypothetical protein